MAQNFDPNQNYQNQPQNNNAGSDNQNPGYNENYNPQDPNNYPQDQQFFDTGYDDGFGPVPEESAVTKLFKKISNFLITKWWLVLLVLTGISVVIIGAFSFFQTSAPIAVSREYKNVQTEINSPKNLSQGTPGVWEVNITNNESVPISNIILQLQFDSVFKFTSEISPRAENPQGSKYLISRLDEKGGRSPSAKIRFEGILTGNVDVETIMTGLVSYNAELGNSRISPPNTIQILQSRTKITSPDIDLSLSPTIDQVQNAGEAEFTVKITNRIDSEFKDLRIQMQYPGSNNAFTYTSSEYSRNNTSAPQTSPDNGDNTWIITRLPGKSEQTLKVRGKIFGANDARLTFGVEVAIKAPNNDYRVIRQAFKDVKILSNPISLKAIIVGKGENRIFAPGETLTFEYEYRNESQKTFDNVQLTTFIDDPANILDLSSITFSGGDRGDITGNQILWRATRVPQLQTLRPGQGGKLSVGIKVKELDAYINPNLAQTEYTLRPGVNANALNIEQISFAADLYKGKGNLEFFQEAKFLMKNLITNKDVYRITWRLRTWQTQVQDVVVKSVSPLPAGGWLSVVTPASDSSAITYNQVNGEIIWQAGKLSSYTGRAVPEKSISFDMEITADSTDTLLNEPKISGLDVFTAEKYNIADKLLQAKKPTQN